jgi:hypothetical protein
MIYLECVPNTAITATIAFDTIDGYDTLENGLSVK